MVTTRRKSAVSHKNSNGDDMGVDGFGHHSGASSSASKKSRKRAAGDDLECDSHDDETPQKKKTKTSKSANREGKVTARSLMKDLLATLPLELIYEVSGTLALNMIFEHLHPLDLLHIARASKLLRSHLMSKRSITVWKTAREAVIPPVPDCPKDQSEPQWAMLLFTHDCTSGRKLYLLEQIAKMVEIVEGFHVRIDAGVEGARAEFDSFIEKKKVEAAEQVESGKELRKWAMDGTKMRDVTEYQLKQQRKEAMVAKLVVLGHDPRDVRQAADKWRSHPSIFDSTRQLSDS
ncbi:hypothetical protein FRC00_009602, partial [Tulasnella sp. 408]